MAAREKRKNKKNNKKRGKVKIVAGIMTREQESDSTLLPEKEEGGMETPTSQGSGGKQGYQRPLHGGYVPQPRVPPTKVMCSFCGGADEYRDCPVMHQYIREQADTLAQRRLEEYHQLREWGGYGASRQVPSYQGPLFRGGDQIKVGQSLARDPPRKKPKNRKHLPGQE